MAKTNGRFMPPLRALEKLGGVISINMALLAELPAPDAIPLKTAKNHKTLHWQARLDFAVRIASYLGGYALEFGGTD